VVISRISSVLQESLFIGTPYLACLLNPKDKSVISDCIDFDSYLTCFSIEELIHKIERFDLLVKKFYEFRKEFFIKQKILDDCDVFGKFVDVLENDGLI
jgi:hypothetical protein